MDLDVTLHKVILLFVLDLQSYKLHNLQGRLTAPDSGAEAAIFSYLFAHCFNWIVLVLY